MTPGKLWERRAFGSDRPLPRSRARPGTQPRTWPQTGVRNTLLLTLPLICLAHLSRPCPAQAIPVVQRQSSLSVFAAGATMNTGYNNVSQTAYIFGGDYTHFTRRALLDPSLELRVSVSPQGVYVAEKTYSGGIKAEHQIRRLRPYADLLFGKGIIDFQTRPPFSDNAFVYTYGGGLDIDLLRNFGIKLDAQRAHWHVGDNDNRTPNFVGGGIFYRVPFHRRY